MFTRQVTGRSGKNLRRRRARTDSGVEAHTFYLVANSRVVGCGTVYHAQSSHASAQVETPRALHGDVPPGGTSATRLLPPKRLGFHA